MEWAKATFLFNWIPLELPPASIENIWAKALLYSGLIQMEWAKAAFLFKQYPIEFLLNCLLL
jgi:hypothetical protein